MSVGEPNGATSVHNHQTVRSEFQDAAEELLGFAEALLCALAFSDVRETDHRAENGTVLLDRRRPVFNGETGPILAPEKFVVNPVGLPALVCGEHGAFL
ncbi:MAG TPA: hypothetical protein VMI34_21195, partial [Candidatus Bathyarchaeia archaeon]|nr:hypothetical protein [Candidatus Bathyarchaeia archaeon]